MIRLPHRGLALDKGSVRSFDNDGRLRVKIANISKAQVSPYKGEEIPGWQELGLEPDRTYQMLRDPDELKAAAPSFNGIQLLKAHKPVDASDHQMWDIVGTTGSEAAFDGTYLTNSLFVWTKEGIDLIESEQQCELSCGYHYTPVMVAGTFQGHHYDGKMTRIEGNHVALVEEGRAGPDVVVGDAAFKTEGKDDMKPNRLQYAVLMRTAAAIKPLLAMDAKVNFMPLVKGLDTSNFAARRAGIIDGAKKLIAGKTIAKDASIEHLAKALDMFSPDKEEKGWDESVSEPQHKAMEAAAHGESNLGIPKSVGEEFSKADEGKSSFGDSVRAWAKDRGLELSDEDYSALDSMHTSCSGAQDEDPDEAMDEESEEAKKDDEDEKGAEDEGGEEKDDDEEKGKKAPPFGGKDKGAKDKQAKDKGKAMDKGITQDELNKAIASATTSERKRSAAANEAREFVRPYVGALPLALDSAESILRAAAKTMSIEDADTVHESALKQLIKMAGSKKQVTGDAAPGFFSGGDDLAMDGKSADTFSTFFPGAGRIGVA